jgi:hypothetical protein
MRHCHHSDSPYRHAIVALDQPDGYVDALLGLARRQAFAHRGVATLRIRPAWIGGSRPQISEAKVETDFARAS